LCGLDLLDRFCGLEGRKRLPESGWRFLSSALVFGWVWWVFLGGGVWGGVWVVWGWGGVVWGSRTLFLHRPQRSMCAARVIRRSCFPPLRSTSDQLHFRWPPSRSCGWLLISTPAPPSLCPYLLVGVVEAAFPLRRPAPPTPVSPVLSFYPPTRLDFFLSLPVLGPYFLLLPFAKSRPCALHLRVVLHSSFTPD